MISKVNSKKCIKTVRINMVFRTARAYIIMSCWSVFGALIKYFQLTSFEISFGGVELAFRILTHDHFGLS